MLISLFRFLDQRIGGVNAWEDLDWHRSWMVSKTNLKNIFLKIYILIIIINIKRKLIFIYNKKESHGRDQVDTEKGRTPKDRVRGQLDGQEGHHCC